MSRTRITSGNRSWPKSSLLRGTVLLAVGVLPAPPIDAVELRRASEPPVVRVPVDGGPLAVHGDRAFVGSSYCVRPPMGCAYYLPVARHMSLVDPLHPIWIEDLYLDWPGVDCPQYCYDVAADSEGIYWLGMCGIVFLQCPSYHPPAVFSDFRGFAARGGYVYAGNVYAGGTSLAILRRECEVGPERVASLQIGGPVLGVALEGDRAYLACDSLGLRIVDIANPAAPEILGGVAWSFPAVRLAVLGGRAYVTDTGPGLQVIDASDPTTPRLLGRTSSPVAGPIAVCSGRAYVAGGAVGVLEFNIEDPGNPRLIQTMGEHAIDVAMHQGLVYATTGASLDVFRGHCTPQTPLALRDLMALPIEVGIQIRWAAEPDGRFQVLRADQAQDEQGAHRLGAGELQDGRDGWAYTDRDVLPGTSYAYWVEAIGTGGDRVRYGPVEATAGGARFRLGAPRPNPTTATMVCDYELPSRSWVHVECFDVSGRLVRRIDLGQVAPGRHTFSWDGLDERGGTVAAGLYWVRLRCGLGAIETRVVLLRNK